MNPTLRELKDDEIVKHGDLWIDCDWPIAKIQDITDPLIFNGVFADVDEIGEQYSVLKEKIAETWHCYRARVEPNEHDPDDVDPDQPRNIDMTL